ncbi:MAG: acetyl-CoA decarbonylase/synthase complex subunit beta, partial [Candidatus Bathyarchaeota archaeon]
RVDPKGPLFTIDKGDCLDDFKGEFSGANSAIKEKSLGENERVYLYTAFEYPHTSCGCFEGVAFYIPEVEGLGLVHRGFGEKTINGLPFSTLADSTAGGRQIDGFHGISIEYMRSPKFLQADGGLNRVVWMPAEIKDRVKEYIPSNLIDKIATENDVANLDELKTFLEEKQHPVTERWITPIVETTPSTIMGEEEKEAVSIVSAMPITTIPMSGGGFKIILKDAKIVAKKLIIRRIQRGD